MSFHKKLAPVTDSDDQSGMNIVKKNVISRKNKTRKKNAKINTVNNMDNDASFTKHINTTADELGAEELFKRVCHILKENNPKKFEILTALIPKLNIITSEQLHNLIDLIHEQAVNDPNASAAYAELCSEVAHVHVYVDNLQINVKNMLLNRCQIEFAKHFTKKNECSEFDQYLNECSSEDKKNEEIDILNECNRNHRMAVGNIRFIGELFMRGMLVSSIMNRCLQKLLENLDEQNVECACILLNTVGKKLDNKDTTGNSLTSNQDINLLADVFEVLNNIKQTAKSKLSDHVQIMIQDVIELKKNNWVVMHKQDLAVKIKEPIENQELNTELVERETNTIESTETCRFGFQDSKIQLRPNSGNINSCRLGATTENGNMVNELSYENTPIHKGSSEGSMESISLAANAFRFHGDQAHSPQALDTSFGNKIMFNNWISEGELSKKHTFIPSLTKPNAYEPPDLLCKANAKTPEVLGPKSCRNKKSPNSNVHVFRRTPKKPGSSNCSDWRSKCEKPSNSSAHIAHPNLMMLSASNLIFPKFTDSKAQSSVSLSNAQQATEAIIEPDSSFSLPLATPPNEEISDDKCNKAEITAYLNDNRLMAFCRTFFEEFLCRNGSFDDTNECFRKHVDTRQIPGALVCIVAAAFAMQRSDIAFFQVGKLFITLTEANTICLRSYHLGLKMVFRYVESISPNIPLVWDSLAKILVHQIVENLLTLQKMKECCLSSFENSNNCARFLSHCINVIRAQKGVAYLEKLWLSSGLKITDFMEEARVNDFVTVMNMPFLMREPSCTQNPIHLDNTKTTSWRDKNSNSSEFAEACVYHSQELDTTKDEKDSILQTIPFDVINFELNEAVNVWRHVKVNKSSMTGDELKTQELYEHVEEALENLIPLEVEALVRQIRLLNLDTLKRLQGVVSLVFEKALDAPTFSTAYACLCRAIRNIYLFHDNRKVTVKKLLTHRCLMECGTRSINETQRNALVLSIEECRDQENRKELTLNLEEYDAKHRTKFTYAIKFIGELFNKSLFTPDIMSQLLSKILESPHEMHLEALCEILATSEKRVQLQNAQFDKVYSILAIIGQTRKGCVSKRVLLMIKNVIKLRRNYLPNESNRQSKTINRIGKKNAKNDELPTIRSTSRAWSREEMRHCQSDLNGGNESRNDSIIDSDEILKTIAANNSDALIGHNANSLLGWDSGLVPSSTDTDNNLLITENNKQTLNVETENIMTIEYRTKKLYNTVRRILHKLTPQKFSTQVTKVRALNFDTLEQLEGVVDLVFRKATDEPDFGVAYAEMCFEINNVCLHREDQKIHFKKILSVRCQTEFNTQFFDKTERNALVQLLDECSDHVKRNDLICELSEYDRRIQMKSVGIIWFIGELFNKHMLSADIVNQCLNKILAVYDERCLENVCTLLKLIEVEVQNQNAEFNDVFSTLTNIEKTHGNKICNRLRLMIQDLIELRQKKWPIIKQDLGFKTVKNINKQEAYKRLQIEFVNMMLPEHQQICVQSD